MIYRPTFRRIRLHVRVLSIRVFGVLFFEVFALFALLLIGGFLGLLIDQFQFHQQIGQASA